MRSALRPFWGILFAACVVALFAGGCGRGGGAASRGMVAFVFVDTTSGQTTYALRGADVFAAVSAPGGGQPQLYATTLPDDVLDALEHWRTFKGSTTAFKPGEGGYSRVAVSKQGRGASQSTKWRSKDTNAKEWFGMLHGYAVTDENKTDSVPSWVSDNEEIMGLLGLSAPSE